MQIRKKDGDSSDPRFPSDPWWKTLFPDFRGLPESHLRPDLASASTFISHVTDAFSPGVHSYKSLADLVINCTGLSASKLGGVNEKSVYPVRGQIVLVRNDSRGIFSLSGTDDGPDERAYIMDRAAGGGLILGGTYQENNSESQFDPNIAMRIMKRSVEICPELTGGRRIEHLDIIRLGVGPRPARKGGARIQKERIEGVWVVHSYGRGGARYQASYGCAEAAVRLVEEVLAIDRDEVV